MKFIGGDGGGAEDPAAAAATRRRHGAIAETLRREARARAGPRPR
jgi:hypothetical protein